MASKNLLAVDIGTSSIKTMVVSLPHKKNSAEVVSTMEFPSAGLKRGIIFDEEDAVKAVAGCLEQLENNIGVDFSEGVVSIGGTRFALKRSRGTIAVSRADNEIAEEDMDRVIQASKTFSLPPNRQVLHVIPHSFFVDGADEVRNPLGMKGVRLEVESLIIEAFIPAISNTEKVLNANGFRSRGLVSVPLAGARAATYKKDRELGVVGIDIGAGTTSVSVFEDGRLLHAAVLPVGSSDVTNDIAIGLKISPDIAEKIKVDEGYALSKSITKKETINLSEFLEEDSAISRKYVANIIEARYEQIFDAINEELKKIDRVAKLPGGAVLYGGGSRMPGVEVLAKRILRLAAKFAKIEPTSHLVFPDKIPLQFFPCCGLILWAFDSEEMPVRAERLGIRQVSQFFRMFMP